MNARRRMLRGGLLILAGQAGIHLLALIRNFMVARLISPEDFGIAATFAVTLLLLEQASDLAMDKLLIQAPDGEDRRLQHTLQTILLIRGMVIAAILLVSAGQVAAIFGVPEARPAFAALAVVPLLRGALNLDVKRLHRHMRYGRDVGVNLCANALGAAVAIALAWAIGDYHAMLGGVIAVAAGQMLGSHLVAERRYGLSFDRAHMRRALHFGWPLMLSGLVIAATAQGDRFLVGAAAGMHDLALYAAGAMLVSAPATLLGEAIRGVGLPWLAAVQDSGPDFARRSQALLAAIGILAAGMFVPLMLLGTEIVALVFGPAYRAPELLMVWLCMAVGIRILRQWPSLAALARGDTRAALIGNAVRVVGLALGAGLLALGAGYVEMAAAIAVGELAGLIALLPRMAHRHGVAGGAMLRLLAVPLAALALGAWPALALAGDPLGLLLAGLVLAAAAALATLALAPALRGMLRSLIR